MTADHLAAIKQILEAFARAGADELEVTQGSLRLRILKRRNAKAAPPIAATPEAVVETLPVEPPHPAEVPTADGILVTAAMHGTFHRAPAPGAEPFVSVGGRVVRGQQLCILEAMKVFNAVTATHDGVVASIHVENGEDVMTGQPLFTLEATPQLEAAE
jgi:acetyl-CoA carboxylase biotin carboxyl carrier protein